MNFRRPILIALLTVGVVGGYGSAIYRAAHRHSCDRDRDRHGGCHSWHERGADNGTDNGNGGDNGGDGDRK